MQALQKIHPSFGLELRDVAPPPAPRDGEVVLDVGAVGICGTDLHIYEWSGGYEAMTPAMPVTLGHEFSGIVAAAGPGAGDLAPGALVAVRPSVVCGQCAACVAGNTDDCTQRKGLGITRNGGLARHVTVPAINCVVAPAGIDAELAALTEPMTVSAESVATGEVAPGARVLVLARIFHTEA
jgi:threonine dehydrogenase-like Zn-dependent dehydrogenase